MNTGYQHTQHAPLWLVLCVPFAGALAGAAFAEEPALRTAMLVFAGCLALIAVSFAHLTVRDAGDVLEVRYGPLPFWGTRVRYDSILHVTPSRSRLIDGFGIHWIPVRGWTFNLWGFDCVEVTTRKGPRAHRHRRPSGPCSLPGRARRIGDWCADAGQRSFVVARAAGSDQRARRKGARG